MRAREISGIAVQSLDHLRGKVHIVCSGFTHSVGAGGSHQKIQRADAVAEVPIIFLNQAFEQLRQNDPRHIVLITNTPGGIRPAHHAL